MSDEAPFIYLLPGLNGNPSIWRKVLPNVQREGWAFRHGASFADSLDPEGKTWTIPALADALIAEITAASHKKVILVTHSAGIFVGLEICAQLPSVVHSVVALNGGLGTTVS